LIGDAERLAHRAEREIDIALVDPHRQDIVTLDNDVAQIAGDEDCIVCALISSRGLILSSHLFGLPLSPGGQHDVDPLLSTGSIQPIHQRMSMMLTLCRSRA